MNVQKLNEILRSFDLIKYDFFKKITLQKKYEKKKLLSLYLYCFGPKHKYEGHGPKISSNWGLIGCGYSCMVHLFANSKVFKLHAILHDAAGSVKSTTYKGPGYCYLLPRFPSSCFLGHVTNFSSVYMLIFRFITIRIVRLLVIFTKKLQRKRLTS